MFHDGGGFDLPGMVLQFMGEMIGELWFSLHDFAEDSGENFGENSENVGFEEDDGSEPGSDGGAVDQRETFFGLQLEESGGDAGELESLLGGNFLSGGGDGDGVGSAGEHTGYIGEGNEVTGGRDATAKREAGSDLVV